MDANTVIIIVANLCGCAAVVATLKNDIYWLKKAIDKQEQRIEKLEGKIC